MKRHPSFGLRIVVLAAGFSTRLGQSKSLARIRGTTLLRRTLLLASSVCAAQVIVVVPRVCARVKFAARGLDVSWVANRHRSAGLASSVRCGIGQPGAWSGALLMPVDLALLQRRELLRLVWRWRGCPRQVVARRIGIHGATPLILPRWLRTQALGVSGDVGLRDWLRRLPAHQRRLLDLPSAEFDIDTAQDLAAARAAFSGRIHAPQS